MKRSGNPFAIFPALLLAACAVVGSWHPASAADIDEDPFVRAVARDRSAVLAVGTYLRTDEPTAKYFGTGFLIDDGTVLVTNLHVVDAIRKAERLDQMRVFVPDSPVVQGIGVKLWAEDRHHDLALLKLTVAPVKPLELEAEAPKQGQSVGVIGYPLGTAMGVVPAVHKGVVAAVVPAVLPMPRGVELTPELADAIRRPYMLYQLDLVVYPGHSGSPLIDAHTGKVLGIVNKTLALQTREHLLDKPSAISYAIPVKWIDELLQRTKLSAPAPAPGNTPGTSPGTSETTGNAQGKRASGSHEAGER